MWLHEFHLAVGTMNTSVSLEWPALVPLIAETIVISMKSPKKPERTLFRKKEYGKHFENFGIPSERRYDAHFVENNVQLKIGPFMETDIAIFSVEVIRKNTDANDKTRSSVVLTANPVGKYFMLT